MTREPEPDPGADKDPEAPEADFAEQHTPARPGEDTDSDPAAGVAVPLDADPADVFEQSIEVPYDDEDDR